MASKIFQSPRAGFQTAIDTSISVDERTSSVLAAMKALSESHRVLETVLVACYHKSRELPLSGDQKLSILCVVLFFLYCFVIYPYFLCPTRDIPGPLFSATALGDQLFSYHKLHDNTDQWALSLHEKYGSVVRLTPTLVSVNDPLLLPTTRATPRRPSTTLNGQTDSKHLFKSVSENFIKDVKLALKGQKTVDINDLLLRHLQEKAPVSFATALAHTIYQLAHPMHRHYLNRLVKEILAVADEDIATLDLLDVVVKESLRTQQAQNHHAAKFVVDVGGSVIGDYLIQDGIEVVASLYCVSRNRTIFSRPYDFNPLRWLDNSKSTDCMEGALTFMLEYHRNIKPGFDSTLANLKILLATILRSFDMKLPLGEQPNQLDLVSLRNGGCRVRFRKRKQVVEKKVRFAQHVIM